jgi:hypothetical protein
MKKSSSRSVGLGKLVLSILEASQDGLLGLALRKSRRNVGAMFFNLPVGSDGKLKACATLERLMALSIRRCAGELFDKGDHLGSH